MKLLPQVIRSSRLQLRQKIQAVVIGDFHFRNMVIYNTNVLSGTFVRLFGSPVYVPQCVDHDGFILLTNCMKDYLSQRAIDDP